MFAHAGMLTLVADDWESSAQAIKEGLLALVGDIPGLTQAQVGVSAGVNPGTASLMFVMQFDSEESWRGYGDHPLHKELVATSIAPVLEDKRFFQTRGFDTVSV